MWASKGGAGYRQSECSRAFPLDKTDVRREETQKNTVHQDAWLKGTQKGTRASRAHGGRGADLTEGASGRWVGGRHEAKAVSHIPSPVQRGLPQGI